MPEFIYQMNHARKAQGNKLILDDVTLSFYPGAKIESSGQTVWVNPHFCVLWQVSLIFQMAKLA